VALLAVVSAAVVVAAVPVAAELPGGALLTVTAEGPDPIVERRVDLAAVLGAGAASASLQIREADAAGNPVGAARPAQFDADRPGSTTGMLVFRLRGESAGPRHVLLSAESAEPAPAHADAAADGAIAIADVVDGGFAAWRITTQTATWYYHKGGGAFSRAVDPAGNDWISWNTTPRYAGMYRGVGNVGADWFHPGWDGATSWVEAAGPLKVTLRSMVTIPNGRTNAGTWEHRVEIYDTFVRDTFTQVGADTWWYLYEGTPGGPVNGKVRSGIDVFHGSIGGPQSRIARPATFLTGFGERGYTVFAVPDQNRSMFFSHQQAEATNSVRWDPDMGIFGFGRDLVAGKYLRGAGHTFIFGLTDTADGTQAATRIGQFWSAGEPGGGGGGGGSTPPGAGFVAVTPTRVLDTRGAQGPALVAGETRTIGLGAVPAEATAAVLNVTATAASAATFIRVWPGSTPPPSTSSLNIVAGDTVPNLVTTGLGAGATVSLATSSGTTHLVVDLVGYYLPTATSGGFHAVTPIRALDTRVGPTGAPLGPGGTVTVDVAAVLGVSAGSVAGVVLNTTATGPTEGGFLTVYPAGAAGPPLASNLNFRSGQTVANAVASGVGPGGVTVYNPAGSVHVVVDIMGWFETGTAGARFVPIAPVRVRDTRDGAAIPVGPGDTIDVAVNGPGGAVPADASAVVGNLTAVWPTAPAFVTVWPAGAARPLTSVQNSVPGMVRANQITVGIGAGGISQFNNDGSVHLVTDLVGYYR